MKISEILAIAGKPGLFKILASSSKNLVVESLIDGKRTSVPGSVRVSSLADITMYTTSDDVPLKDILEGIHKKTKGEAALAHTSSPQDIKDFIDSVVKDLDHERIYVSDLKKLVQWYNLIQAKEGLPFESEEEVKEESKEEEVKEKAKPEKKAPKKTAKAAPKKAAPKKAAAKKGK